MGKAAENERLKLQASLLNNLGTGFILTGVIFPSLAIYQDSKTLSELITSVLAGNFASVFTMKVAVAIFCLCFGIFLHRWGMRYLKRLKD